MRLEKQQIAKSKDNAKAAYLAATQSAAVLDVSGRTQMEITGADRHSFLHSFCTNDINGLQNGSGCEAFVCNAKGRILGHIFVFADGNSLWVESVPGQAGTLRAHFEKYHLLEDMQLVDRSGECCEFLVHGPQAFEMLVSAGIDVTGVSPWQHRHETDGSGLKCHVKRVDLFGSPSFLISAEANLRDSLRENLIRTGVVPAGDDVLQALRIEANFPWYGIDLTEDNLAQEAGRTEQAISFQKGCYLGQEPIARLNAMGHVNRELKSFVVNGSEMPEPGIAVLNPNNEDKTIGRMTSVAWSWRVDRPVGLGTVRTQFSKPGTELPLATDPRVMVTIAGDGESDA